MAANQAAGAAAKMAKPAAKIVGAWLVARLGEKAVNAGFDKAKEKASEVSIDKRNVELAQSLARARGWKYMSFVVAQARRYVVFNEDKQPVSAFPAVEDAMTPAALAERHELKGFVPRDEDLLDPPPKNTA
jgi:hypothetical protein